MPISLLEASKSISLLKKFIEGDALTNALESIAINETKAAIKALNERDYSKNPREPVNRCITHLESAHQTLKQLAEKIYFAQDVKNCIYNAHNFNVCCILALCHKYLNDKQSIINDWLTTAQHPSEFNYSVINDMIASINPFNKCDISKYRYLSYYEFKIFSKNLGMEIKEIEYVPNDDDDDPLKDSAILRDIYTGI